MTRNVFERLISLLAIACCVVLFACGSESGPSTAPENDGKAGVDDGKDSESEKSAEISLALKGRFLLADSLVPVNLKVTVLDENLDSVSAVKSTVVKKSDGSYAYESDKAKYPFGYARLAYTCVLSNSSYKMEFVQYVDLNEDPGPLLNIFEALESERVKKLVQKEKLNLKRAKQKALLEIYRVLDCESRAEYLSTPLQDLWWLPYIYGKYEVSTSGKDFYKAFEKLRSAVGGSDTWRDFVSENEIVDSLYSRFKNGKGPWVNEMSVFTEDYYPYAKMWADYYGLKTCLVSTRGDTARIANKKSAFNKELLVCDSCMVKKNGCWRSLNDREIRLGLCLKDSTVVDDGLVYKCNAAVMQWENVPMLDAVKFLHGECTKDMLGEVVTYDKSEATCLCSNEKNCGWKEGVPDESIGKYTPVDALVKKSAGECTEKREKECVAVSDSFYICKSGFWEKTDKMVYTWGVCESSRKGELVYEKGLGAFKCGYELSGTGAWTWLSAPLPEYHKDVCEENNKDEIKTYDDLYYVCNGKNWRAAADSELVAPVLQGFFCDASNEDEVKKIDDAFYVCRSFKWTEMDPYEVQVYKARVRLDVPEDYCKSGIENTTLFWDETNQALYGCAETSANHKKIRWMQFSYRGESSNRFIAGENKVEGILSNWKNIAGGKFTSDGMYEVELDGVRYIFRSGVFRSNDDDYGNLYESVVVVDGKRYEWQLVNGKNTVRMPVGEKHTTLESIENKSGSFTGFYEKWMEQVVESSTCPNTIHESIPCAKQTMSGLDEVDVLRYGENSFTTLEQARLQAPPGFHIPDVSEWETIIPKSSALESSIEISQYEDAQMWKGIRTRYNLFWTSDEKDKDTQYCFEYIREVERRGTNDFYYDERFVVASRVVECPKDLYPMVQALYVADGDKSQP